MNEIRLPYDYIPSPTAGSPIASGYIYIGTAGTDPTIVENQLSVSARQEDGTEVVISQPIRTNAGGNPVLSGSPITLLVSANEFSITVQNSIGAQVYTQSNATTAIPASGAGDASITTSTGTQTIQESIDTRLFVGAAEPSFTVPYMKWAAIADDLMRIRNAADSGWVDVFTLSTGIPADTTLAQLSGVLTAANKIPYATGIDTAGELDFLDEDDMVSDSATAVPSQQSVKAYTDATSTAAAQAAADAVLAPFATANFTGIGTAAFRASTGFSSLTDNGTGDYTLNFTVAASGNYVAVSGGCLRASATNRDIHTDTSSTSGVRVYTSRSSTGAFEDIDDVSIVVFDI